MVCGETRHLLETLRWEVVYLRLELSLVEPRAYASNRSVTCLPHEAERGGRVHLEGPLVHSTQRA